ncbi:MAG: lyase family protein [Thermostichales cyanobacterium DRC_bins_46]
MSHSESAPVWSQRFAGRLHPQIARFNASLSFDIALLPYDIAGSQAHARMLAACGILTPAEGEQIQQGLAQILKEWEEGSFNPLEQRDRDGNFLAEDVHYAVEKRLIELIGEVGKKLHTGRSRNDQVATDLRLYLRDQIHQIQGSLRQLQRILVDLAEKHLDTVMPGYNHLQRAQTIPGGSVGWESQSRLQSCDSRPVQKPLLPAR